MIVQYRPNPARSTEKDQEPILSKKCDEQVKGLIIQLNYIDSMIMEGIDTY